MLDYYLRKLSEAEGNPGKYFYIVGDGEISCSYFDSDTHMYMPDYHDLGDGYIDKQRFDTLQDVFNAIDEEGLLRADEKINFPDGWDLDDDIQEEDCTPVDYPNYIELLSWWCEREEEHGPEYHERTEVVNRLIQVCKEK